jgi:hypothetical protein
VPGGDGEPEDVGAGAGVAGGDLLGEACHCRGQHRLRADRSTHRRQPALVVAAVDAFDDEPVDVLAGEPHLDPGPGHHGLVHPGRHQVVERAVQVGKREVDEDPGDRLLGGRVHR